MPFLVTYHQEDHLIESRLVGTFDWNVMENMVPEIARLVIEKTCERVLLDFQAANLNLSTYKIYVTPEKLAAEFQKYNVDIRLLKRALVLAKRDEDFDFLETVTLNRQQTMKLFTDPGLARDWLKRKG